MNLIKKILKDIEDGAVVLDYLGEDEIEISTIIYNSQLDKQYTIDAEDYLKQCEQ